jgi:hypothetical protein
LLAHVDDVIELDDTSCPFRVIRVGFVMSAISPVYPQQQTFPDAVGTSHLCQERTSGARFSCSATSAAEHGESNGRVQKLTAVREGSDADLAGLDRGFDENP